MIAPSRIGLRVSIPPPNSRRYASVLSSASLVRVVGWRQVHAADATRRAPSGVRQGGPWALKT
jgi:hypothetical protein